MTALENGVLAQPDSVMEIDIYDVIVEYAAKLKGQPAFAVEQLSTKYVGACHS